MTRGVASILVAVCAAACAVGCRDTVPRTQVMVEVDAQAAIAARADAIRVVVTSVDEPSRQLDQTFDLSDADVELPVRVALVPKGDDSDRLFRVAAFAVDGTDELAVARARSGYVAGKTLLLRLVLYDACEDVTCGANETCDALGECVEAPNVDPCSLEALGGGASCPGRDGAPADAGDGDASDGDGGTGDGGTGDGGGPRDGGTPSTGWAAVECGEYHTCAIRADDGRVFCWGSNTLGQCSGPDDAVVSPRDTTVAGARLVTAGGQTSCAVVGDGDTRCWGGVYPGDGTSTEPRAPVGVDTPFDELSVGSTHACGTVAEEVRCWGTNGSYELGTGVSAAQAAPVTIDPQPPAAHLVAAGDAFNCSVNVAGNRVDCWGKNDVGQLGVAASPYEEPRQAPLALGRILSLAAGARHACVTDGTYVACWGDNTGQAVLPGGTAGPSLPTPVTLPESADRLGAGNDLTCARLVTGAVVCWGSDTNGQRGDGPGETPAMATDVDFPGSVTVAQISVGYQHACAVTDDGRLFCWGRNEEGQLGDGSRTESEVPVEVPPVDL